MGKRNTKQDQSLTNKNLEIIQKLNIIDDFLFAKMCEDKAVCEEIFSTILERPIHVLKNDIQYELRNAGARSVRLDCLCVDQHGTYMNIEVQNSNNDDHLKRMRYNAANIDTSFTEKGIRFEKLADIYVIYIAQFDIFGFGDIINHIDEVVREHPEAQANSGIHKIVVNAAAESKTKLGQLMKMFLNKHADQGDFPAITARLNYLTKTEKGVNYMCKELNDYLEQRTNESHKQIALIQLKKGWLKDADAVMESFGVSRTVAEQWIAESKQPEHS